MKRTREGVILFLLGFFSYSLLELFWRSYTHWSMGLTGGVCFLLLYRLFEHFHSAALWKQCVLGAFSITGVEFVVGCIVNIWLKWNIWDYSACVGNLFGQVCPRYTALWCLLCVPACGISRFLQKRL